MASLTSNSVTAQVELVRAGDLHAVSKAISTVERGGSAAEALVAALGPMPAESLIIGITGTPGAGKSTMTSALIGAYRRSGLRVGVVAIDPSSPLSGGAFLGDRVRMQDFALDPAVFIRSMANHGELGGVAASTLQVVRVLAAAGCHRILVETVGVGQAEIGVAALADTTVVVLTPGTGDAIQGAKAGILEVADIVVVNKADRDGAAETVRELRYALSVAKQRDGDWTVPILMTVATRADGVAELISEIDRHFDWSTGSGRLAEKRRRRVKAEVEQLVLSVMRAKLRTSPGVNLLDGAVDEVLSGGLAIHSAAARVLDAS